MRPFDQAVYWNICALCASSGRAIDADDERLYAIMNRARRTDIAKAIERLCAVPRVGEPKLLRNGSEVVSKRMRNEIEAAAKRMSNSSEAALKRWHGKDENEQNQRIENATPSESKMPSPSPSPSPSSKKDKGDAPKGASGLPEEFVSFWAVWPHKVGQKAALKAWKNAKDRPALDVILKAVESYAATKPADRPWCNPSTWLNQGRWGDAPAEAAPQLALAPVVVTLPDDAEPWRAEILKRVGPQQYRNWIERGVTRVNHRGESGGARTLDVFCVNAFHQHHCALNFAAHFAKVFNIEENLIKFFVKEK